MIHEDEWRWIVEHAAGDFDHLLLGSSLPMFLTPGLHYIEAWDAQLADRGRTKLTRRLGEKIRQTAGDGPLGLVPVLVPSSSASSSTEIAQGRATAKARRRRRS